MVSSMQHVARGDVEAAVYCAAFALTLALLRMYSKRLGFLIWVFLSIQPILWLPDSATWAAGRIKPYLPADVTPSHVFASLAAILVISIVLKLFRRPKTPKFDVDETSLAVDGNFQHVYNGASLENLDPFFDELRTGYNLGVSKSIAKRKEQLLALRRFFVENEAAIVQALKDDLGRPEFEGLYYDVLLPISEIDRTIKSLSCWTAPKKVGFSIITWPSDQWLQPEPIGVVLVMSCWNYPINLALLPVVGAIAAGNVVALKPSLTSPASGKLLQTLLPKYMDPRVLSVVGPFDCSDIQCSQAIMKYRFDHVFFTGSSRGGKAIMELAAKHLTPCTMELGGKNPVFVSADADISLAAKRTVWGRLMNAGQQCIAPDYVLCDERVVDKFCEKAKEWIKTLYGEDTKNNGNLGRINATQTERIAGILKSHGGTIIYGGECDKSANYVQPTIVRCEFGASILKEETFGPILAVVSVKSLDQAINHVNANEKPLALYIFSNSKSYQQRIIMNTSSGGVTVNATLFHAGHSKLPFGGVGNSGFGAYHGKYSFDTFTHNKPVLVKATWTDFGLLTDPLFLYPPWNGFKINLLRALAKLM